MKKFGEFVVSTFVAGLLIIVPIYLAVLLLLKAMQSVVAFVKRFAMLLPEWIPAEHLLSVFSSCWLSVSSSVLLSGHRQGVRSGSESRSLSSKEFQDTPSFGG